MTQDCMLNNKLQLQWAHSTYTNTSVATLIFKSVTGLDYGLESGDRFQELDQERAV